MERLSLGKLVPPWIRHEHLSRYRWATNFTEGRRVIDAASGSGYGSDLLSRDGKAAQVRGFDVSAEAVQYARRCYANGAALSYEVADVNDLPLPNASADLYLSFETIEHVEDDAAMVAEAHRVLASDGIFICSTPNRETVNPGITINDPPGNPFHLREYTREELAELLLRRFRRVQWYGQTLLGSVYVAVLNRLGRRLRRTARHIHQAQKVVAASWRRAAFHFPQELDGTGKPEVLIAVCTK